jgi:hypothetical protein
MGVCCPMGAVQALARMPFDLARAMQGWRRLVSRAKLAGRVCGKRASEARASKEAVAYARLRRVGAKQRASDEGPAEDPQLELPPALVASWSLARGMHDAPPRRARSG